MSTKAGELSPLYVRTREPMSPAESGLRGARSRWGEPRIVRIDQLDPSVAAAVRALVRADESAKAQEKGAPAATAETPSEVRSASSTTTSRS